MAAPVEDAEALDDEATEETEATTEVADAGAGAGEVETATEVEDVLVESANGHQ